MQTKRLVSDEASMLGAAHFVGVVNTLAEDGELLMADDHRQLTPIIAHHWDNDDRPPAQYYRMHESAFDAIATLENPEDERRVRRLTGQCGWTIWSALTNYPRPSAYSSSWSTTRTVSRPKDQMERWWLTSPQPQHIPLIAGPRVIVSAESTSARRGRAGLMQVEPLPG